MYHIEAKFPNGFVRAFHYPRERFNADAITSRARDQFSHTRLAWVRICDGSGPVRYVSHSGEICS